MRRIVAVAVLIAGLVAAGWGADGTRAKGAGHPLVGSWLVEVEIAGEPPLRLPNLASFTGDGVVVVSAPSLLPELPDSGAARNIFSSGHGAWAASDDSAADVRFVFLVVDERGNPASINLVDGQLDVAVDGQSYAGEFTLTILDARGSSPTPATGTWRATRIVTGSGAMTMPAGMEGAATPAATPDA